MAWIRTEVFKVDKQAEFARIIGISPKTVTAWEREKKRPLPNLKALTLIREAALREGIDWRDEWFFERPDEVEAAE